MNVGYLDERSVLYASVITDKEQHICISDDVLGSGSYGIVYAANKRSDIAVKIYRKWWEQIPNQQRLLQIKKLEQMSRMTVPHIGNSIKIAWPIDVFISDEHDFVDGYVMPRAPDKSINIATLIRKYHGSEDAKLAADQLEKSVRVLHKQDIIIGDVNGNNIVLAPNGELWFFDVDSWQLITPDGKFHYAQGATDYYTHHSIFQAVSGTQPNCCNPNCPYAGKTHSPTPSCRPRKVWHDMYGIKILLNGLRRKQK